MSEHETTKDASARRFLDRVQGDTDLTQDRTEKATRTEFYESLNGLEENLWDDVALGVCKTSYASRDPGGVESVANLAYDQATALIVERRRRADVE